MYEWLTKAAEEVRWRKFFVFAKDWNSHRIAEAERTFGTLPKDYVQFLLQFGQSILFRNLDSGSYNLAIYSDVKTGRGAKDESILTIGHFINGGGVHFRKNKSSDELDPGVFEDSTLYLRKSADSFEEWLKKRFESCRKLYKKSEWKQIVEGAAPFTEEELRIVEAIEKYSFANVGIGADGNILIRVHNRANMKLNFLSVGVRSAVFRGGVYLDVSDVESGQQKIIAQDCYKHLVPPEHIELFRHPPPEPEDRRQFAEFGGPRWLRKR